MLYIKIALLIFSVCMPIVSFADIYKYIDADGRLYYDDKPHGEAYSLVIHTPKLSKAQKAQKVQMEMNERIRKAELYKEKVKSTAKFLDDVEAERKI
ncbi:MAG: hypothetical protein ACXVHO_04520 [Methanobacterium sp.]